MAGYSGTPLPKKLGIKSGSRLAVAGAPNNFSAILEPLPAGVTPIEVAAGDIDVLLFFTTAAAELTPRFPTLASALAPAGGLWICWPKRASGVPTDLTENVVREIGLATGLVDNKVCAIDDAWSGLRFVRRLADRPRPRDRTPHAAG